MQGIYKDDNEGFLKAVMAVMKSEAGKDSSLTQTPSLVDLTAPSSKTPVEDIFEDRDRFRADIADQLRRRVIKYRNFTKRSEKDFIKAKVNEADTLERQTVLNDAHIQHLEQKTIALEGSQEDFDKEAYYKLKDELR